MLVSKDYAIFITIFTSQNTYNKSASTSFIDDQFQSSFIRGSRWSSLIRQRIQSSLSKKIIFFVVVIIECSDLVHIHCRSQRKFWKVGIKKLWIHFLYMPGWINLGISELVNFIHYINKSLLRRKSVASFPFNWLLYLLHVIFFSFLVAYWETNRKDKDQYLHNSLFYATVVVLSLWVHYLTVRS